MRIRVAKTASYCMGVKRALDKVLEARGHCSGPLYTCGPLIHNPQVLQVLERLDIHTLPEDAPEGSTIFIRAHGIPPKERKRLKERGYNLIDATCPRVANVQALVKKARGDEKEAVIILGDRDHAEVEGLLGFTDGRAFVVEKLEDLDLLPPLTSALLVAQTTFNKELFARIVEAASERIENLEVYDTICDATQVRQDEARRLGRECDGVIVVGGYHSANTRRLAQVVREVGGQAWHVETEEEIPEDAMGLESVGVTAGASTPYWLFHRVVERLWERQLRGWRRWGWTILSFLVRSYLLIALGAGGVTLVLTKMLHLNAPLFALMAALYIFSMHVVNGLSEAATTAINEPVHQLFLRRHRVWLLPVSVFSGVFLILLSWWISHAVLFLVSLSILLGGLYQIPLPFLRLKLKDFPGSKDFFSSLAWAFFTIILPAFHARELGITVWTIGGVLFLIAFVRSLLYDVKDLQGDRMVGRETIPVVLGKRWTQRLAMGILLVAILVVLILPSAFLPLLYLPVYALLALFLYHRRIVVAGVRFGLVVDSAYLLFALLTWMGM